ncbi:MAG TPA: hypothetical protein VFV38_00965 [Ktedonobacteraceae bacterium]|nr:hypothetical protein [Ktedonobacteraceae bacterium]
MSLPVNDQAINPVVTHRSYILPIGLKDYLSPKGIGMAKMIDPAYMALC